VKGRQKKVIWRLFGFTRPCKDPNGRFYGISELPRGWIAETPRYKVCQYDADADGTGDGADTEIMHVVVSSVNPSLQKMLHGLMETQVQVARSCVNPSLQRVLHGLVVGTQVHVVVSSVKPSLHWMPHALKETW
jgi:hypothetical protein